MSCHIFGNFLAWSWYGADCHTGNKKHPPKVRQDETSLLIFPKVCTLAICVFDENFSGKKKPSYIALLLTLPYAGRTLGGQRPVGPDLIELC